MESDILAEDLDVLAEFEGVEELRVTPGTCFGRLRMALIFDLTKRDADDHDKRLK